MRVLHEEEGVTVFIPAGGDHKRWVCADHPVKQLAPIHGVPIIRKLCNQILNHGHSPVIVSLNADLCPDLPLLATVQPGHLTTSIFKTRAAWPKAEFCCIHGDVVIPDCDLEIVLGPSENTRIQFYGKESELFAVRVKDHDLFELHLRKVIEARRNGMLWEVYRSVCGFNLDEHRINEFLLRELSHTQDVDFVDQWRELNARA